MVDYSSVGLGWIELRSVGWVSMESPTTGLCGSRGSVGSDGSQTL